MQRITDHHVHSSFSGDCNTFMEEVIERGISLGMKEIMFTDHHDLDHPCKDRCFQMDLEQYASRIQQLNRQYKEINILMGIEVGYQAHLQQRLTNIINQYPFDFVICSMHSWDNLELSSGMAFRGKTQQQGYMDYLKQIQRCVKNFECYDVYGHLDFIARYGDFEDKRLQYEQFSEIIDDILLTIIGKGKGIELNTSGLRYQLGYMHPNTDILSRYVELGGRIITLGSDAHYAKDLCADFDLAIQELTRIGVTEVATFHNRIPTFQSIIRQQYKAS